MLTTLGKNVNVIG